MNRIPGLSAPASWFEIGIRAAHLLQIEILFQTFNGHEVWNQREATIRIETVSKFGIQIGSVVGVVCHDENFGVGWQLVEWGYKQHAFPLIYLRQLTLRRQERKKRSHC